MGLRRHVQPRRGTNTFGPGCLPRRAVATAPAPWRRPLAALVLAGGIGALGLNTTTASAAEPAASSPQTADKHCVKSGPRRAAPEKSKNSSAASTAKKTSKKSTTSKPRRAAGTTNDVTTTASLTTTTGKADTQGATAPLAKGSYRISARFGATGNWSRYHTGQDFSAASGTTVRAVVSGTVISGNVGSWAGTYVAIRAEDGSSTLYAHLSSKSVKVGQKVTAGQKIGEVGNSGRSFGSHLHFEYYPAGKTPGDVYSATNPMTYLSKLGISM